MSRVAGATNDRTLGCARPRERRGDGGGNAPRVSATRSWFSVAASNYSRASRSTSSQGLALQERMDQIGTHAANDE